VIFYTGFNDLGAAERIRRMGIKAVLRKPITIYGLSEAIREVLESPPTAPPSVAADIP
jgi:DNA-binding NarL/FixJ family response regulator